MNACPSYDSSLQRELNTRRSGMPAHNPLRTKPRRFRKVSRMSTANTAPPSAVLPRARVLVVDDERINREIVSRLLMRNGYEVLCALNGQEALELVKQRGFDLLLLDVVMPEMDGFECLTRFRVLHTMTELPVIMVTAETDRDTIVKRIPEWGQRLRHQADRPRGDASPDRYPRAAAEVAVRPSPKRRALCSGLQGSNDGLWDWDLLQGKVFYSPRWKEMLGHTDGEIGTQPSEWLDRVHPEDQSKLLCWCSHRVPRQRHAIHIRREAQMECEFRMRHRDGSYRWMLCSGVILQDAGGNCERMAGSLTDITRGKVGDTLTGLPNRLLFVERLEQTIERTRRLGDGHFAAMFLDLDNFKLVNDSLGHQAGDRLLISVAERLDTILRSSDLIAGPERCFTVARQGGDEFTVLIDQLRRLDDAQRVAERIISVISEPFLLDGNEAFVGASIGIALGGGDTRVREKTCCARPIRRCTTPRAKDAGVIASSIPPCTRTRPCGCSSKRTCARP